MAAAKVCIRANVPAEDPVAPAKAMGMKGSDEGSHRVNRPMTANMAAAPTAPATRAPPPNRTPRAPKKGTSAGAGTPRRYKVSAATDPISTSLKVVATARTPVYMSFLYYVKYKIDIIE